MIDRLQLMDLVQMKEVSVADEGRNEGFAVDAKCGYRDSRDLSGTAVGLRRGASVPQLPEELRAPPARHMRRLGAIVAHLHRDLGHVSNRTMVEMLRRARSHGHVIAMAKVYCCDACDSLKKPGPKLVSSTVHQAPGMCMELDNIVW